MRNFITAFYMCACIPVCAGIDPSVLRTQVFGNFHDTDLNMYTLRFKELAVFGNSYVIYMEEYNFSWNKIDRDSTKEKRTKHLDEMIQMYQRAFEGMSRNMDTSTSFQLEFLNYKQDQLTPYLNNGMTRTEVEALPEFRYKLRHHYCDMLIFELMNREVWTKANSDEVNLRQYFNNHPEKYQGQPFEISRTKVIHDYQKELEADLDVEVRQRYPPKINTAMRDKL